MKSSAGKISSIMRRSLALSNFLRIQQSFLPQFLFSLSSAVMRLAEIGDMEINCTEIEMRQDKGFKKNNSCI